MKKILIIKGSSRENGYVSRFCNQLSELYKNEELRIFDCFKESFKPCNGCNYCENAGKCINNDLEAFYNYFELADTIFFLSPVYNGTFSAPLKALIDRFQVYYTGFYKNGKKQQISKKRDAYLIVTAGRDAVKAFDYMKSQLSCAFTILNISLKDSFLLSFTDTNPDFSEVSENLRRSITNG